MTMKLDNMHLGQTMTDIHITDDIRVRSTVLHQDGVFVTVESAQDGGTPDAKWMPSPHLWGLLAATDYGHSVASYSNDPPAPVEVPLTTLWCNGGILCGLMLPSSHKVVLRLARPGFTFEYRKPNGDRRTFSELQYGPQAMTTYRTFYS